MTATLTRRAEMRGSGVVAVGAVLGFVWARRSDAARATGPSGAAANGYGPTASSGGGQQLAALGVAVRLVTGDNVLVATHVAALR